MMFYDVVLDILKQDERFFTDEGQLLRNAVYEAAMKMDSTLLKLLYNNEVTRERFFTDVEGISVFDKVGFGWVINNRQFLPDSYTRYKNKIGLVNGNGDYISTANDVELVFPYKDCVLEGGRQRKTRSAARFSIMKRLRPMRLTGFFIRRYLQTPKGTQKTRLYQLTTLVMQITL